MERQNLTDDTSEGENLPVMSPGGTGGSLGPLD